MAKKKPKKQNGPKYQRYFYAYSDKMIVRHVDDATFSLQNVLEYVGRKDLACLVGPQIPLIESLLAIELPDLTGDIAGKYGVIFVPKDKAQEFKEYGPEHKQKTLGPRERDPDVNNLVYLTDFNPLHNCIGNQGKAFCSIYAGSFPIPYRKPENYPSIREIIGDYYPELFSAPYKKYIKDSVQIKYLHLHSLNGATLEKRLTQGS